MSIDLSAANAAAHDFIANEVGWDAGELMADQASHMVATIAPLIEAAVREQIARDIEALITPIGIGRTEFALGEGTAYRIAASVARGEQR
jgi:hypothetical protein